MKKIVLIILCVSICQGVSLSLTEDKPEQRQNLHSPFWFNLMLNGQKTGYFSFNQHTAMEDGKPFIIREEETFMKIKRSQHLLSIHSRGINKMDADGRLIQFSYRSLQGDSDTGISGEFDYEKGVIHLTHTRNEHQRTDTLNIIKDSLTEYQALTHLKKRGWTEGDSLSYSTLMTEKGSYINVNMKLEKIEKKGNGDHTRTLYKIVRTIRDIPGIRSVTWIDPEFTPHSGELVFPHITYTLEPTLKKEALQLIDEFLPSLDLARIPLENSNLFDTKNDGPDKIKKIVLLLKLKKGEAFTHNLDGGLQHVGEGNLDEGLQVAVHSNIPLNIKHEPIHPYPEALSPFLCSNSYIESDDARIIALAKELTVKSSAWETAIKMKNWVHDNVLMTFNTGFASALEVLNSREGDCTEHAVLTAALCRSCGIPARVAFGYNLSFENKENPVYVGHMWNEVFIGDEWIPIDSTSPDNTTSPFRLRFFFSSLDNREFLEKNTLFSLTQNVEITLIIINPR